jgi:hypothetical protein
MNLIKIAFEDINNSNEKQRPQKKTELEIIQDFEKEMLPKILEFFPKMEELVYMVTTYARKNSMLQHMPYIGRSIKDVEDLYSIVEFWKENGQKLIQEEKNSLEPSEE